MKSLQLIVFSLLVMAPAPGSGTAGNALTPCTPATITSMADLLRCSPPSIASQSTPLAQTGLRLNRASAPREPQETSHSLLSPHAHDADKLQFLQTLEVQAGPHNLFLYNWVHPVPGELGYLAAGQRFGAVRFGTRPADCGHGHCGVDIPRVTGTNVYAAAKGVVVYIGRNASSKAGLWVELSHPEGVSTRYLHLHSIRRGLRIGEQLSAGSPLGEVGNTGSASRGSHLHFELYQDHSELGKQYLDPTALLRRL